MKSDKIFKNNQNPSGIIKLLVFFKKLPEQIKLRGRLIKNIIKRRLDKRKYIFLIGTPNYGNLGDQIIAVAELEWLKDFYSDYVDKDCTQYFLSFNKSLHHLLLQIKKDDLIFLQGGGNLNNLYVEGEHIRRKILKKCPLNKVVLFQQSINIDKAVDGFSIKEETEKIYNAHKHFTVIAREETSYRNALKSFDKLTVMKYPDMATYLFTKMAPSHNLQREGVITCIRTDAEKFYSDEEISSVIDKIKNDYSLTKSDTHINKKIPATERKAEVQKMIDLIAKHKVMVTDRFHGVVFSILANTPCVVLRSADHKITDGVRWFDDVDGIFFAKNIEDVPELIKKAEKSAPISQPDFSHYFKEMYQNLK